MMRYLLFIAAGLMAVTATALTFATIAEAQTAKPERLHFTKGKSAKTIQGDQSRVFVVNLRAGQTLTVKLVPSDASTYFNVTAPGAEQAMFIGSSSGNTMKEVILSSGDYRIDLYLMRNAARRGETSNFTITIGATG